MTFDVLLPIATYPDPVSTSDLAAALGLCARIGARVTVRAQEADIPPIHNVLGEAALNLTQLIQEIEARSRGQATDLCAYAEEQAAALGIEISTGTIRCRPEALGEHLVELARYHDLTMSICNEAEPERRSEREALIFGSGGPVILVPDASRLQKQPTEPLAVMVAWDGGRASSRALRDAMPLLADAASVSILSIGDDKTIDTESVSAIRTYLDHHGISTEHVEATRGHADIGSALQDAALGRDSDLLVMGAFGHSRFREFVLGGATQSILSAPRLPILLSH